MNIIRNIIISGILLSFFFITDSLSSGFPVPVKLWDVNTIVSEQSINYSFELSERPFFSLQPSDDKSLLFSLKNTDDPDILKTKIEKTPFLDYNGTGKSNSVIFKIVPEKSFNKIECAWINDKSIFTINLEFITDDNNNVDKNNLNSSIKDIRFNFKENTTRMVIGTSKKPGWEITHSDKNCLSLILNASSENLKTRSYESDKWLKHAQIKGEAKKPTNVSLKLNSEPDQVSIFWMPVGNRLVLDLFNKPEEHIIKAISRDIVRIKIEKDITPDLPVAEEKKDITTVTATPVNATDIKPLLKTRLPISEETVVNVENLSPEEAFLFGRIRQAKEIYDYDTGITLANQFLREFKESSLREVISFWRGDFYYDQWEKGAKGLDKMVLKAYNYAIARSQNSHNTLLSYIKMARVTAGMKNGLALGYLSIVISKKNPEFMPLAYLTRGKVFLEMGQPEKAIKDFKILLQDYRNSQYAMEANLWIGSYYHKMGLYKEAEQKLNEINERFPGLYIEYPEFMLLNAKNNLYLKKYDAARQHLFRAVNLGGQQETIDLLLSRIGDTYHNEENDKEAKKYYRMVIDYYPESEGASISKLRLAEYFSDITMLESLSKDKANEPIGELAVLEKAYQLYEKKQYEEAIETLMEVASKPVQTETRKEAKRLYVNSIEKEMERLKNAGMTEEVIQLYDDNRRLLNDRINPEALLTVAEAYKIMNRYSKSISIYQQIKSYDLGRDSRGKHIHGMAESYNSKGDINKAIFFLEKNKDEKMKPVDSLKVNLLLADMYKLKGRNKDAGRLYTMVIQNVKDLPKGEVAKAYLNLGTTFKNRRQYSQARNALNHSIAIGLENNTDNNILQAAYMELGNIYYSQSKHHKAVKAFEKGIEKGFDAENPEYWETRFKQAIAYSKVGESTRAESLLTDIAEEGNDTILQQRAQLRLGSLVLAKQLKSLSMGAN